jgi:hypothetical protein
MCLLRAPEKYIAGAALDRAGVHDQKTEKKLPRPNKRAVEPLIIKKVILSLYLINPYVKKAEVE